MTLIVNGAEWNFNGLNAVEAEELIDRALEFIDISRVRGEKVLVGDDFQTRPMYGAATLWELFSDANPLSLPPELAQELSAWLVRADKYADADVWPEGFDDTLISIGDGPFTKNDDVAWVHYSVRAGVPTASLSLLTSGVIITRTATGDSLLHFVSDEQGRTSFWRDMMVLDGDGVGSLLRFASRAYPHLYFVDDVLSDAQHLVGGYVALRQGVKNSLEVLNDWGHWIFTCPPPALAPGEAPPPNPNASPPNRIIELRLAGFGLTAAPENPNVRDHKRSREARETIISGRRIYCEWHVKLQLHQNRIHFHGPIPESDDKVVIGMIHEHLPLPG